MVNERDPPIEDGASDALGLAQADLTEQVAEAMRGVSRAYVAALVAALENRGFVGLTPASVTLLARLPSQGAQTAVMARETRRTKQATGKVVAELEAKGYVERVQDPSDGRAQLVRPTAAGRAALDAGAGVKSRLAAKAASVLGAGDLQRLHTDLARLENVFGSTEGKFSTDENAIERPA